MLNFKIVCQKVKVTGPNFRTFYHVLVGLQKSYGRISLKFSGKVTVGKITVNKISRK